MYKCYNAWVFAHQVMLLLTKTLSMNTLSHDTVLFDLDAVVPYFRTPIPNDE